MKYKNCIAILALLASVSHVAFGMKMSGREYQKLTTQEQKFRDLVNEFPKLGDKSEMQDREVHKALADIYAAYDSLIGPKGYAKGSPKDKELTDLLEKSINARVVDWAKNGRITTAAVGGIKGFFGMQTKAGTIAELQAGSLLKVVNDMKKEADLIALSIDKDDNITKAKMANFVPLIQTFETTMTSNEKFGASASAEDKQKIKEETDKMIIEALKVILNGTNTMIDKIINPSTLTFGGSPFEKRYDDIKGTLATSGWIADLKNKKKYAVGDSGGGLYLMDETIGRPLRINNEGKELFNLTDQIHKNLTAGFVKEKLKDASIQTALGSTYTNFAGKVQNLGVRMSNYASAWDQYLTELKGQDEALDDGGLKAKIADNLLGTDGGIRKYILALGNVFKIEADLGLTLEYDKDPTKGKIIYPNSTDLADMVNKLSLAIKL